MKLRARIVTNICDIGASEWDSVVSDPLMRHGAVYAFDEATADRNWVYALVADAEGPYAAIAARRHRGSPLLARVLVEITPHLGLFDGIQLRAGVTLSEALPRLSPILGKIARRRGCVGYSILTPESEGQTYSDHGFAAFEIPPTFSSDLSEWPSYEALLERLPHRGGHEVRRARRRSEKYGLKFEVRPPVPAEAAQMFSLLQATYGAHESAIPFNAKLFSSLWAGRFAEHHLFCGTLGERLVVAVSAFRDGDMLMPAIPVFDYEIARPSYAYFSVMAEIIQWAYANGIRTIDWGPTNEVIKQRYGAAPIRALAAIKPAIPLFPGVWNGIRRLLRSDAAARALAVPGIVEVVSAD
jgi:predicted N-acyltransferase